MTRVSWYKKGLVVGIIVLLFCISVIPSTGISIVKKTSNLQFNGVTHYVGGNGPNNYTKIQDAIINASDGDTVFVYDDSSPYYENVQINESINLIGEDRNTTVIDANNSGNVTFITCDNVSIREFTIQNSGGDYTAGIKIDNGFGFCTFTNNIIIDNKNGIYTAFSNNNIIKGNTFFDNEDHTIRLACCSNNTIVGNTIDHSMGTFHNFGIILTTYSRDNNISENTIENNEEGIRLGYSDYNLVLNNIINCEQEGIQIDYSSHNSIIGNNISNHGYHGIYIRYTPCNDNIIYHNNLIDNAENAYDEGDNIWDDGEYGNYWSDYEERYPDAKKKKGIWDTPYEIPGGDNKDMYPLIKPWPKPLSKTMPRDKTISSSLFLWFLEQYPLLNRLLFLS